MNTDYIAAFRRTPIAEPQQHDPLDLAVRDIHMAGADFMIAILHTDSIDDALRLNRRLDAAIETLAAISRAALERANNISKARD